MSREQGRLPKEDSRLISKIRFIGYIIFFSQKKIRSLFFAMTSEPLSAYERQRLDNIEENRQKMIALGLEKDKTLLSKKKDETSKKKSRKSKVKIFATRKNKSRGPRKTYFEEDEDEDDDDKDKTYLEEDDDEDDDDKDKTYLEEDDDDDKDTRQAGKRKINKPHYFDPKLPASKTPKVKYNKGMRFLAQAGNALANMPLVTQEHGFEHGFELGGLLLDALNRTSPTLSTTSSATFTTSSTFMAPTTTLAKHLMWREKRVTLQHVTNAGYSKPTIDAYTKILEDKPFSPFEKLNPFHLPIEPYCEYIKGVSVAQKMKVVCKCGRVVSLTNHNNTNGHHGCDGVKAPALRYPQESE